MPRPRPTALLLALLFSTSMAARVDAREDARRANVVLVMTDDQGYGDIASHGNDTIETPTLDRLRGESVRLTNFHVDPTCSPTRSALMTGRYSHRTGVWHTILGRSLLRRDEVTIADIFRGAGYRTGIIGKWHLGDNYPFRVEDRGFDESLVHGGGGIGQTPDAWGNDYFDDRLRRNGRWEDQSGYCTTVFVDAAIDFVTRHRERPFFLYLPTNVPHGPYNVPDAYRERYEAKGVEGGLARFYGMISHFDGEFGRLLAKLEELGVEKDTIVVFLTDNGTSGGGFNAGMRGRKGSPFEGGHRVPCFIRWPGRLEPGRDVDRLAAHIDLLPTLAELVGIELADGVDRDGRSLVPLLHGKEDGWPARTLFVQSHRIEQPKPWRQSAVMTDRWRLVDGEQLFDVLADPGQDRDLAKAEPDVVRALREAYEAWYESSSGRFDEFCEIVLGSPKEDPARLTCHDWHGDAVPWNQGMVGRNLQANGFWAVEVERAGRYRVTLRLRPEGVDYPLRAGTAAVTLLGVMGEAKIEPGRSAVSIEVEVPAGRGKLETLLREDERGERGAYFVAVERL